MMINVIVEQWRWIRSLQIEYLKQELHILKADIILIMKSNYTLIANDKESSIVDIENKVYLASEMSPTISAVSSASMEMIVKHNESEWKEKVFMPFFRKQRHLIKVPCSDSKIFLNPNLLQFG